MLKLKWESLTQVPDITCPILYISGSADTFVPTRQTTDLFNASTKAQFKDILIVEGAEHNNTFMVGGQTYFNKLEEFFQKCTGEQIKCLAEENLKKHDDVPAAEKAEAVEDP